jgi:hypothetical protein
MPDSMDVAMPNTALSLCELYHRPFDPKDPFCNICLGDCLDSSEARFSVGHKLGAPLETIQKPTTPMAPALKPMLRQKVIAVENRLQHRSRCAKYCCTGIGRCDRFSTPSGCGVSTVHTLPLTASVLVHATLPPASPQWKTRPPSGR